MRLPVGTIVAVAIALSSRAHAQPRGKWLEYDVRRQATGVLDRSTRPDAEACRWRCAFWVAGATIGGAAVSKTCQGYSWSVASHQCELYDSEGTVTGDKSFVSGVRNGRTTLSVAYYNVATWKPQWLPDWSVRAPALVRELQKTNIVPDVIMLTELNHYSDGYVQGPHRPYEMLAILHGELLRQLGVSYRIAAAPGVEMDIGPSRLGGLISQGEAVLYNPSRLENHTADGVTVAHGLVQATPEVVRGIGYRVPGDETTSNAAEAGAHLRASVPVCIPELFPPPPGSARDYEGFARAFLDGPEMITPTAPVVDVLRPPCQGPVGPSWSVQYSPEPGHRWRRVGMKVRLALKTDPLHPIELYDVHTTQRERAGLPDVTDQSIKLIPLLINAGPAVEQHMPPIFANDINVSYHDTSYDFLLATMAGWNVEDWGPGAWNMQEVDALKAIDNTVLADFSSDQMGLLVGVSDPALGPPYTDFWKTGRVLYPSVVRRRVWMPEAVDDWRVAPAGADLTKYHGPGEVFTDHASQVFEVESLEAPPQSFVPAVLSRFTIEALQDPKLFESIVTLACAEDPECSAWRCERLGLCK